MARRVRFAIRLLLFASLAAALADLPLPAGSRPRRRVHAVDVSPSTRCGAFTSRDAMRLAHHDLRTHEGSLLAFDADASVVEGPALPASGTDATDLAAAIDRALWLEADDILIHTDGRPTRGDLDAALYRARARGVPVHAIPTGPVLPRDRKLLSVEAPNEAPPGAKIDLRVTVVSTFDTETVLLLDGARHPLSLSTDLPQVLPLEVPGPGEYALALEPGDDFPENDRARCAILPRTERRRVRILCSAGDSAVAPLLGDAFDVEVASTYVAPFDVSAVVLESIPAGAFTRIQMEELRDYVTRFGGGLLAMGGPSSLAVGGYGGTPVEEVLPFWAFPEEDAAVVLALDRSGSMSQTIPGTSLRRFDAAVDAVERISASLRPRDRLAVIVFSGGAEEVALRSLRLVAPTGPTRILPALAKGREALDRLEAPRKLLVLVTDGEVDPVEEPPERLRRAAETLGVRLAVVATGDPVGRERLAALGVPVVEADLRRLADVLQDSLAEHRDLRVDPAAPLRPAAASPILEGISSWPRPARIHRTTAKPGAQVLLTAGEHPALGLGASGRGRSAATAFGLHEGWTGGLSSWPDLSTLLVRVLDHLGGAASSGLTLSATRENGLVQLRCRHSGEPPAEFTWLALPSGRTGTLAAPPTGSREVGASFPFDEGGTVHVRAGGATASLHVPYALEFAEPGIDAETLTRITQSTGGRILRSASDLDSLPSRRSSPVRGRPWFTAAALLLFLLDAALGAFWRS